MSSMAQMPDASVSEVRSISGVWHWWTVTTSPIAAMRKVKNSSAPMITLPPESVVSMVTSSVKHWR